MVGHAAREPKLPTDGRGKASARYT